MSHYYYLILIAGTIKIIIRNNELFNWIFFVVENLHILSFPGYLVY